MLLYHDSSFYNIISQNDLREAVLKFKQSYEIISTTLLYFHLLYEVYTWSNKKSNTLLESNIKFISQNLANHCIKNKDYPNF